MAAGGRVVVVGWLRVEGLPSVRRGVHRYSPRQPVRPECASGRQDGSGRDCNRGSEGELAHPVGSREDGNHFNGWYITRPIRHVNQELVTNPLSLMRR
jgi:hypothetical protein